MEKKMENKKEIKSALRLRRLVFEKISFERLGLDESEHELKLKIESRIAQKEGMDLYKVSLALKGNKLEEYLFEIILTGYFEIYGEQLEEVNKQRLIDKNAIAILMPYMRSQVSLLTAQPGMECEVLPAFNINNMLDNAEHN